MGWDAPFALRRFRVLNEGKSNLFRLIRINSAKILFVLNSRLTDQRTGEPVLAEATPRRFAALGCPGAEAAGADETVQPASTEIHLGPAIDGEIDHNQCAGGHFLMQVRALVDVPCGN
jgi:hypothetical protein